MIYSINRVGVGITNRCLNKCSFCCANSTPSKTEPRMSTEQFTGYARQIRNLNVKMINATGGDPLAHDNLYEFVGIAQDLGFEDFEIVTGGWSKEIKEQRINTLQRIFSDFGQKMTFWLVLTLSPYMFGGNQEKSVEAWRATIEGFRGLAPLMNRKVIEVNIRDDGTALQECSLPIELSGILLENEGFIDFKNNRCVFQRERLILNFDADFYDQIGRGKNMPPALIQRARPECTYTELRKLFPGLLDPYLSPDGYLLPCCETENDSRSYQELALKVEPNDPMSIRKALEWYAKNESRYFARAREIMRRVGNGVDFCPACIEARSELVDNH